MKTKQVLIIKSLLVFAVYTSLSIIPLVSSASEITDGVKKTIDAVIEVISDEELNKDTKKDKRRALLREIISNKFSYPEMARKSLAKYWKERTPDEKKEFIELFGKLHDNSYTNKIESYSNEKIIFTEEKVRGNIALVKSIMQKEDDQITIHYKLIKIGNDWKVYDFVIEGVSLLRNYRTQFVSIIRKSSYQELVKIMKKKVGEIE